MPLNDQQEILRAGPASRKRTHEQITRSQSRSVTPSQPSTKRRRTNSSLSLSVPTRRSIPRDSSASSSLSSPAPSSTPRFVGDGLDFRRPTTSAMAQVQDHDTVDLTLDEDSDEGDDFLLWNDAAHTPRAGSSPHPSQADRFDAPINPPQQGQNHQRPQPEIITLSDDENDNEDDDEEEIQIVGSRPVSPGRRPARPTLPPLRSMSRRLGTPPPGLRRSNAQTFAETLRQIPTFFGLGPRIDPAPPTTVPFAGLGILDHARAVLQGGIPQPLDLDTYDHDGGGMTDYENIDMDYGAPAFVIEDPGADDVVIDDYKPPTPAKQGFTKDIEEEEGGDVLVCCSCEDELATGHDDLKAQVWVAKKCGHVYCGACASRRVTTRGGTDRSRKKLKVPRLEELRLCKVEGCEQKLTSKTAMFQVYL